MSERSLNEVSLIGRLGKDAETRFTPSGVAVTNFSIATSRSWKPKDSDEWKEETDWHNCTLWRAEKLAEFLTKGKKIFVRGSLKTRKYEKNGVDHYATDVIVDNVILLADGGNSADIGPRPDKPAPKSKPAPRYTEHQTGFDQSPSGGAVDEDDVPF